MLKILMSKTSVAIAALALSTIAIGEAASASVRIFDWRSNLSPSGVIDPAQLESKIVIELNSGEVSDQLKIVRRGLESGQANRPRDEARVQCLASETTQPEAADVLRRLARRNYSYNELLAANTSALIDDSTVVICRPPNAPTRSYAYARVRRCVFEHARMPAGSGSVTRTKLDVLYSGADGSIGGVNMRRYWPYATVSVSSRDRETAARQALFASCGSMPSLTTLGQNASLTRVDLLNEWAGVHFGDKLVNDQFPRNVREVVEAIENGRDAAPAPALQELQRSFDAANARASQPL